MKEMSSNDKEIMIYSLSVPIVVFLLLCFHGIRNCFESERNINPIIVNQNRIYPEKLDIVKTYGDL